MKLSIFQLCRLLTDVTEMKIRRAVANLTTKKKLQPLRVEDSRIRLYQVPESDATPLIEPPPLTMSEIADLPAEQVTSFNQSEKKREEHIYRQPHEAQQVAPETKTAEHVVTTASASSYLKPTVTVTTSDKPNRQTMSSRLLQIRLQLSNLMFDIATENFPEISAHEVLSAMRAIQRAENTLT